AFPALASAVNLKFLSVLRRVGHRNFKFKTAPESEVCWCSFDSEVRIGAASWTGELRNRSTRWPCNEPNCGQAQRCSAVLTAPPNYFQSLPLSDSEHSHGSASARQARPDYRRLQGHWGRGRRILCRGRLPFA